MTLPICVGENMRNLAIIAICFLTIGCSSNPNSFWRSPSAIVSSLKQLEGQHLEMAIKRLGLPQAEQSIAGRKIYVWGDSGSVSTVQAAPVISPTTGNVNWFAVQKSRNFKCVVRMVVNDQNIITLLEIKANSVYYCPGQRSS